MAREPLPKYKNSDNRRSRNPAAVRVNMTDASKRMDFNANARDLLGEDVHFVVIDIDREERKVWVMASGECERAYSLRHTAANFYIGCGHLASVMGIQHSFKAEVTHESDGSLLFIIPKEAMAE